MWRWDSLGRGWEEGGEGSEGKRVGWLLSVYLWGLDSPNNFSTPHFTLHFRSQPLWFLFCLWSKVYSQKTLYGEGSINIRKVIDWTLKNYLQSYALKQENCGIQLGMWCTVSLVNLSVKCMHEEWIIIVTF